jgi:hypothetical protein
MKESQVGKNDDQRDAEAGSQNNGENSSEQWAGRKRKRKFTKTEHNRLRKQKRKENKRKRALLKTQEREEKLAEKLAGTTFGRLLLVFLFVLFLLPSKLSGLFFKQ